MLKSRFNLTDEKGTASSENVSEHMEGEEKHYEQVEEREIIGEEDGDGLEEEKQEYPRRVLHREEVGVRLGMLGKTAEGDGYAYLKATLTGMGLTDLKGIRSFRNLLFVDVSDNNLEIEALQILAELPFLILIHADKNALRSATLKKMKYLQVLIMNNNQISSVEDVYQPELCTLEVGYNKISKVTFRNKMPNLKVLDFRYNLIQDISDMNFPSLDSLYLAGNKITSLQGLGRLINLRILHLRNNPIKRLDGFNECLTKLESINLRNCKIGTLRQVKKLRVLKKLDTLVLKGCPYMGGSGEETVDVTQDEEDLDIRIEIIAAIPRLKRINKGVVTSEERAEAKNIMTQWLEDEKTDEEIEEEQNEENSIHED